MQKRRTSTPSPPQFIPVNSIIVDADIEQKIEPYERTWPELEHIKLFQYADGSLHLREGFGRLKQLRTSGSTTVLATVRQTNSESLRKIASRIWVRHGNKPPAPVAKAVQRERSSQMHQNKARIDNWIANATDVRAYNANLQTSPEKQQAAIDALKNPEWAECSIPLLSAISGISEDTLTRIVNSKSLPRPVQTIELSGKVRTKGVRAIVREALKHESNLQLTAGELAQKLNLPTTSVAKAAEYIAIGKNLPPAHKQSDMAQRASDAVKAYPRLSVSLIAEKTGLPIHAIQTARQQSSSKHHAQRCGKKGIYWTRKGREALNAKLQGLVVQNPSGTRNRITTIATEAGCSVNKVREFIKQQQQRQQQAPIVKTTKARATRRKPSPAKSSQKIDKRRSEKADRVKQLLSTTDQTLSQIQAATGCTQNYVNRVQHQMLQDGTLSPNQRRFKCTNSPLLQTIKELFLTSELTSRQIAEQLKCDARLVYNAKSCLRQSGKLTTKSS